MMSAFDQFFIEKFDELAHLFAPEMCMQCRITLHSEEQYLCLPCEHRLAKSSFWLLAENPLKAKFFGRTPVQEAYAYLKFSRTNVVRKILHRLKYEHSPEIGEYFGTSFGYFLLEKFDLPPFNYLIPVPLHESKLRKRGYNQSEAIANGMSKALKIPVNTSLLIRTKATESQTKKNSTERSLNVSEVFQATENLAGMTVLLIDDVITTGATLSACIAALAQKGCQNVSVAALAAGEK